MNDPQLDKLLNKEETIRKKRAVRGVVPQHVSFTNFWHGDNRPSVHTCQTYPPLKIINKKRNYYKMKDKRKSMKSKTRTNVIMRE